MAATARARMAIVAWCLASAFAATSSVAAKEVSAFAARLSSADEAMEYWDVTAWFDSGERVFARFLVTNQGPGRRTAAAVGHVLVGDGDVRPFQWGRREGAWAFSASGLRFEIGKATLDLSGGAAVLTVKSTKRRVDLRLTIEESGTVSTQDILLSSSPPHTYSTTVMAPAAARAELAGRTLTGSGAVTHTWMGRPEEDLLRRRDEIFARDGDTALYVCVLTPAEGRQHQTLVFGMSGGMGGSVDFSGLVAGSSADYPVPSTWVGSLEEVHWEATLERERLRMNPLEILPQPFRFLLSLGGRPQRIWTDARVKVDGDKHTTELRGIAVSTFARPVER